MANKPFAIQGADLTLGGVNIQAGSNGVVIPGVTQAANYFVEEVNDRGDQTLSFQTAPILIDYVTYLDYQNNGSSSNRAEYSVDEIDNEGYIDGITVDTAGEYTGSEAYNGGNDLFAYTGTDTMPGIFTSFVDTDWTQIPYRPKMRAGEVENVGGGGNANTGDFTFSEDTITNNDGMKLTTNRGTLAMGTNMEVPGVAQHFHIAFDGSNSNPPASDLFLGDDHNYVKLPGYELNPTAQFGVEIGTDNRSLGPQNIEVGTVDELVPPGGVWRFFIDPETYPNLGSLVSVGDTVTTSWGTPITATITAVVEDPGLWWIIAVAQDITAGFSGGDTVSFGTSGDSYTWRFGTDGVLTLPNAMTIDASDSFGTVKIGGSNTQIRIDDGGAPPGLYIRTDMAGADHGWLFGSDGDLHIPPGKTIRDAMTGDDLLAGGGVIGTFFVVVNDDGTVSTSTDGVSWTTGADQGAGINRVATDGVTVAMIQSDQLSWTTFAGLEASTYLSGNSSTSDQIGGQNIDWNQIDYAGGYFVAVGSYDPTGSSFTQGVYGYSTDGRIWTFETVDQTVVEFFGNDPVDSNWQFSDVDYNGVGWMFSVGGGMGGGGANGGGVYITDLTATVTSARCFSMTITDKAAWNGSAWYMEGDESIAGVNANLDPRNGTFDGPIDPWGTSIQDLGIEGGTTTELAGGNGYIAASDSDGHVAWSDDNGTTWQIVTPIPYTRTISGITQASPAVVTFSGSGSNGNSHEKVVISGSSVSGYNGTFYWSAVNPTNGLYTDQALTTEFDTTGLAPFTGTATLTWSNGQYIDAMDYINGYFYIGNDDEQIARTTNFVTWTIVDDQTNDFEYWNDIAGFVGTGGTETDRLVNGSNELVLGSTGALTLPQGSVISEVTVDNGIQDPSVGILLTPSPIPSTNPDMAVKIYPTFNDDDHIHITAGNPTTVDLFLGDDDQYVKIEKNGGNVVIGTDTNAHQWTFATDGILTFPSGMTVGTIQNIEGIRASGNTQLGLLSQGAGGASVLEWVDDLEDATAVAAVAVNSLFASPGAVQIITGNVGPAPEHAWTFDADGVLHFPDGTVQTTAYVGGSTVWVQDFETVTGAPDDVVALATGVEYLANGDIVALFVHQAESLGASRYSSVGRFSPNGTKLWNLRFAGSQYTDGWGMAVDNVGNFIYVAGQTDASGQPYAAATLTKIDQVTGTPEWSKIYNAGYENVNTVVDVAADGNVVVVGYSSTGDDDQIVTTKIDKSDGSVVWSRALDGQGNEEAYGMAVGPAGEVVAVGYMDHTEYTGPVRTILTLTAVPASDPAWTNDLLGVTVGAVSYDITFAAGVATFGNIVDNTGNYYAGNQLSYILASQIGGGADMVVNVATTTQEDLSQHMLVVKYNSSGTIQWQRAVQVEAGFDCKGADADIDSSGNIYVCGNFDYNDGVDKNAMIIIKFNSSGVKQWSRKVVGGCSDSATSIVVGPDDCLYLSAVTGNNSTSDFSLVIAKYNLDGTVAWQRLLDNTTTWTFGGGWWFGNGGGSNLAVRDGYVAVAGGYADPGNTVPHAIVAQFDAAGTVFAAGDYDFRAASFSGVLDSAASNITVTDAAKTASNYEFAGVDPFSLMVDNINFLVGTLYSSGIGSTVSQLTNGGYTVTLQGNGSLLIPAGDADNTAQGQIFSDNESSFINLDVQFSSDITGGMRLGTDGPKPVDIVTNTSNSIYKWRFGADGNLTLPQGSTIADTASAPGTGNGQAIEIKPGGAVNANQLLKIYPTVANPDGNHIHLTSGDLSVTDLFLGDDYQFVQIAADGNVCIGTDSANHIWQFGTDGNLTLPGGGTILDTAPTPGITRTKYTGSAAYDANWYSTAAVIETGIVTTISEDYSGEADYSFQYTGYFRAPVTGTYTFTMFADDSGRFWIGPNALAGYTAVNANISIPMYASGTTTTSLTANEFYPIRLQINNDSGPGYLSFSWSNDQGQANTSVLTGAVFADLGHTAITADNDIELRINNGTTSTWQFGTTGNLTLPVDGVIKNTSGTVYKVAPTYGSFYSNITQTNTSVGDAIAISYNVTDLSNGVSITGAGATEIRIAADGVYNIQFSLQVRKTDGGADTIYVWLDKNGTRVDNSATNLYLVGSSAADVAAWNFVVNAAANDYYRLMWMSADSHVEIVAVTAGAVVPAIPSVILTVVPVGT